MNNIKKILVALLFATIPLISFAQNCKFDEDKKDPFTGSNLRTVSYIIGPRSWNWNFKLEQIDGNFFISVRMLRGGKLDDLFPKGRKIMLKLENNKILALTADQDFSPSYAVSSDGTIWTNYIPKFKVDKAFLTDLSASPITDLKVTLGPDDVLLPKITRKQTEQIMKSAGCLLE